MIKTSQLRPEITGLGVAIVGLIFLAPLISNPGTFWDGTLYHLLIKRNEWGEVLEPFTANGRPFSAYLIWAFSAFREPSTAALLVSGLGFALSGACFTAALVRVGIAGRLECAMVALSGIVWPGYIVSLSLSSINFQVALFLFFLALYLFVLAWGATSRGAALVWFGSGSIVLLLSFTGEAPIVLALFIPCFHGAFFQARGFDWRTTLRKMAAPTAWVIFLVLLGLIAVLMVFTPTGEYQKARVHLFGLLPMMMMYAVSLGLFAWGLLKLGALFLFAAALVYATLRVAAPHHVQRLQLVNWPLTLGLIGVGLSLAPYVIGQRMLDLDGCSSWSSRFLMFSGFFFGLSALGIMRAIVASDRNISARLAAVALVALVLSNAAVLWSASLKWQLRWVRDSSVMDFMAQTIASDVGMVVLDDRGRFDDGRLPDLHLYRPYEITGLVQMAVGRATVQAATMEQFVQRGPDPLAHINAVVGSHWGRALAKENPAPKCVILTFDSRQIYDAPISTQFSAVARSILGRPRLVHLDIRKQDCHAAPTEGVSGASQDAP